jgi:hypothetical protein
MKIRVVDFLNRDPEISSLGRKWKLRTANAFLGGWMTVLTSVAAVPPPEKLLPDDTLMVFTVPDCARLADVYRKMPQSQLWNDPAMKPFKDKLLTKCDEEVLKPLQRDLDLNLGDYTNLLQGQLTVAVTQNGWKGESGQSVAILMLLDARDKADQLKKNLGDLRKKCVDAGRALKTEKIREVEFTVLAISSNDVPKTLRKFVPKSSEVQELGQEKPKPAPASNDELLIGQVESLLIVGNSAKAVEKIVIRLAGGGVPALGETAGYQANHQTLFREAPLYGWVNVKAIMEVWLRKASEKKENPEAPNPFDLNPDKLLKALGFGGLKTLGFSFQEANEGTLLQGFLGVPEASREGLFKILAGEPKESTPPSFVPADALKFQRWRIDGKKTWAILEKMMSDISPQAVNTLNFLLDSANTYAKDKDPGFDIRKNLIGNLGDDIITYQKPPRGNSALELASPPSLLLVGSSNADQLAASLKSIFVFLSQQAASPPEEREFLGRKIYSVTLGSSLLAMGGRGNAGKVATLQYAAGAGYVAFSTDAAILEEYLRSSQSRGKALREVPGLAEAAQKVAGPNSSLFGYENQAQTMRVLFESLRGGLPGGSNSPVGSAAALLPGAFGLAGGDQNLKEWLDFSLLPSFDKVSKYFSLSVYGGSAGVDGLMLKVFTPAPPTVKP